MVRSLQTGVEELSDRPREIFRRIVEAYLETGGPIGSRTLARQLPMDISAATIRNVMADLEIMGLLHAPHISAGRLPTESGLRLFVDGLLELGDLTADERASIEGRVRSQNRSYEEVLSEAVTELSGLSGCAGVVAVPKSDRPVRHIEFVRLGPGSALVVLVTTDGQVENRLISVPKDITQSAMTEAANFLNDRFNGYGIEEVFTQLAQDIEGIRRELNSLAARVVEAGFAVWAGGTEGELEPKLLVRGQSKLLEDVDAVEDLERLRLLFEELETKSGLAKLLDQTAEGEGVRVFIGSETKLFSMSGSAMIVAPYTDGEKRVIGSIGIIGPARLNYGRIVPMVDFTARMISRVLSE